jgi:hypothetical protein
LLIKPLDSKWFMTDAELAHEKQLAHEKARASEVAGVVAKSDESSGSLLAILAWAAVGIPLAWGVYRTLLSVAKFFN